MNMTASTQSGGFQAASDSAPQGSEVPHQSPEAATTSKANQSSRQETTQIYSSRAQQLSCLYTKHKTQKRKIWLDGRLVLNSMRASLYDAHPPPGSGNPKLDECEVNRSQCDALLRKIENRIETEKFIIEVTGPWTVSTTAMTMAKPNPLVSQGMQKVMTRKFRKPGAFIPRNPMQERQDPAPTKRQRPLQPGELQQRNYGRAAAQPASMGPPPPEQSACTQVSHDVADNLPDGRRTVHFQGRYGEQQLSQNQMLPRHENHNPQPFFQGSQAQSTYDNTANRQQVPQSAPCHVANRPATNAFPLSAPPQSYAPMQETLQNPAQSEMRSSDPAGGENSFAKNEFNPINFYGEDEELSQEDDYVDANLGWSLQLPGVRVPRNQSPNQDPILENRSQNGASRCRTPENATEPILAKPDGPSEFPPRPCDGPSGAPPSRDETGDNSETLSTNELLKLFGAAPAPAPAQPDNMDESDSATQISEHPTQFEFVLPPASDSSSDEDDSDNPGEQ